MADIAETCRRLFDLDVHQARYMLDTFKTAEVSRQFLISQAYVVKLRNALGCCPRARGWPMSAVNGVPGVSAWRTPDIRRAA